MECRDRGVAKPEGGEERVSETGVAVRPVGDVGRTATAKVAPFPKKEVVYHYFVKESSTLQP